MHNPAQKQSILFIENPIAGLRKKVSLQVLVEKHLDTAIFDFKIIQTEFAGHGSEIAEREKSNFDIIVAVGGDGTINEIARELLHTDTTLAIIPLGSGNGLARHFKIPLTAAKAVQRLNQLNFKTIDVGLFNNEPYLCTAGIGFEAEVSFEFDEQKTRGWMTYLSSITRVISRYKPISISLVRKGEKVRITNIFTLSVANGSQYGNNARIAPSSSISDGLLDVCIIRRFPVWKAPLISLQMITGKINRASNYTTYQTDKLTIFLPNENYPAHIDGDPMIIKSNEVEVSVMPKSLRVMV